MPAVYVKVIVKVPFFLFCRFTFNNIGTFPEIVAVCEFHEKTIAFEIACYIFGMGTLDIP